MASQTGTKQLNKKRRLSILSIKEGKIDYIFLVLLLVLLTVGMVSLFSASFANALSQYGDSYRFISRQVIYAVGGLGLMFFISTINHRQYEKYAWHVYFIAIALLIIVFRFPKLAGARRWIIIGPMTIQPSEVAKFAIILIMAHLIDLNYTKMKTVTQGILVPSLVIAPVAALVLAEPHVSGTILIVAIAATMLFVGGVSFLWFIGAGVIGISGLYFLYKTSAIHYVTDRIDMWLNPYSDPRGKGFQTIQSLYAIGSGGFMGKGIGGSTQKYSYLPEIQNDYIFSIVCEEVGFVGATLIIILFALLVWRGFYIAIKCKDRFGTLLGIGLIAQIGIQVIFNIMVVTKTVPPTGVSLPFFSSGGTSLIMLLMQMGILLSISRHAVGSEEEEEQI